MSAQSQSSTRQLDAFQELARNAWLGMTSWLTRAVEQQHHTTGRTSFNAAVRALPCFLVAL